MDNKQNLPEKAKSSKIGKTVRMTLNIITSVIVVLVVIFAISVVGVRLFGVTPYIILSPSMEPVFHTGGLVYVVKVDVDDLEVGDDITFKLSNGTPATHRINAILPDPDDPDPDNPTLPKVFQTKGVNNEEPDANYVHRDQIIGKAVFGLPFLGYAVNAIQKPAGIFICAIGAIVLIVLMLLPDIFFPNEKEEKKKKKKKGEIIEETVGDKIAETAEPSAETSPEDASADGEEQKKDGYTSL